jgi:hypothetical protein
MTSGGNGGAWGLNEHLKLYGKNFNNGVAEFIVKEIKPTSLLEFGCGVGWYCDYISGQGTNPVHGIEPEPMDPECFKNEGCKQFCFDATSQEEPDGMLEHYDMVLSLEVMEHIPREHHTKMFDYLASKKPRVVLFSGARPGQGGHGHIAERPEKEWISEWESRGYKKDLVLTQKARNSCNRRNTNHIRNINVYLPE